jgi:hypothetical protein
MSYNEYLKQVNKFRNKFKGKLVQNNTRLYMDQETESIYVRFHRTDILEFTKDGKTIISLEGYNTVTTMQRIRTYGNGFWLRAKTIGIGRKEYPYDAYKPITILANGKLDFTENTGILNALHKEFLGLVQNQYSKLNRPVYQAKIEEVKAKIRQFGKPEVSRFDVRTLRQDLKKDAAWYLKRKELKKLYNNNMVDDKIYVIKSDTAYWYNTKNGSCNYESLKRLSDKVKVDSKGLKEFKNKLADQKALYDMANEFIGKNFIYDNKHVTLEYNNAYYNSKIADNLKEYLPLSNIVIKEKGSWGGQNISLVEFSKIKDQFVKYELMDALNGEL